MEQGHRIEGMHSEYDIESPTLLYIPLPRNDHTGLDMHEWVYSWPFVSLCPLLFDHIDRDASLLRIHQLVSEHVTGSQGFPRMHCVVFFQPDSFRNENGLLVTLSSVDLRLSIFVFFHPRLMLLHDVGWVSDSKIAVPSVVVLVCDLAQAILVNNGLAHAENANQVSLPAAGARCSVGSVDASTAA